MRRLVLFAVLSAIFLSIGCQGGDPGLNTAPMTEEEKRKMKEDDRRIDDEERSRSRSK